MNPPDADKQEICKFHYNDVERIIQESIEATLGGKTYRFDLVNMWTALTVEACLNALCKEEKFYKYICNCIIMQKKGTGIHTALSCYWDESTDGCCTIRWSNETMYCIFTVFGVAV